MKTKLSFVLFFILSMSFAQENVHEKLKLDDKSPKEVDIYVILKKEKIQIDSLDKCKLQKNFTKEEWIKNIVAVKDSKYLKIFGNSPTKEIYIYPKRKYQKRIKQVLEQDNF